MEARVTDPGGYRFEEPGLASVPASSARSCLRTPGSRATRGTATPTGCAPHRLPDEVRRRSAGRARRRSSCSGSSATASGLTCASGCGEASAPVLVVSNLGPSRAVRLDTAASIRGRPRRARRGARRAAAGAAARAGVLGVRDLTPRRRRGARALDAATSAAAATLARVFVPTRAYRAHARDVLERHRFAVLTGPPEMGKTAIARMLGAGAR